MKCKAIVTIVDDNGYEYTFNEEQIVSIELQHPNPKGKLRLMR